MINKPIFGAAAHPLKQVMELRVFIVAICGRASKRFDEKLIFVTNSFKISVLYVNIDLRTVTLYI